MKTIAPNSELLREFNVLVSMLEMIQAGDGMVGSTRSSLANRLRIRARLEEIEGRIDIQDLVVNLVKREP